MVAQVDTAYVRTRASRLWPRLLAYALFEGRPLTTRGQWFNPVVFMFLRTLQALPAMRTVEAPAFILGTGRSGTTILGIILSMHKQVGFLNEPKACWASFHSSEDLIGSYHRGPARYRLGGDDATPAVKRSARRVFGGYLRLGLARRLVDKYPELIFRTQFVRAIFPDARFLFLSRAGVATCGSIRDWSERLGTEVKGEIHNWWGADDRKWKLLVEQVVPDHFDLASHAEEMDTLDHTGRAAVEWIVTMREGMRLAANDPKGTLHVPYEAFCADPCDWARRLEVFLGLTHDEVFVEYAAVSVADRRRSSDLDLPEWLNPIFDLTEAELAAFSAGSPGHRRHKVADP